ncbi:hypothetical protein OKW45_001941 [Paraburkholderia sp. WSM4175]|uniref:hypothetical protein n=1 Tax=Paraburkholderia sp. WSM4175 TaxID=2991072 RepID=UPI003D1A005A
MTGRAMLDAHMRKAVLDSYETSVQLMETLAACETVEVTVNCAMLRRLLEEHAILCGFALGRRSAGEVVAGWWQ